MTAPLKTVLSTVALMAMALGRAPWGSIAQSSVRSSPIGAGQGDRLMENHSDVWQD